MAWRPPYHPQLSHTVCGRFTEPQRGQLERPDERMRQAEERRLRLLAFEVFFFGTAMTSPEVVSNGPGIPGARRLRRTGVK